MAPDQRREIDEFETAQFDLGGVGSDDPTPGALDPAPARPRRSSEADLISAARMQARHRASPALPGLGVEGIPGYKIVRELHRGGHGVVVLAVQRGTGREVAIKVMHEGPLAGPNERARFEREVKVLAQLRNPNIVTVHDSGSVAGCFYYVMDYVTGFALDDHVTENDLPPREVLGLFATICHAVNAAHLRGVIHRDLKPSNVRVTPGGSPQILDFGLAKVSDTSTPGRTVATQFTMTGQFVGSMPWSSPEQVRGEASKIDLRTDVYALGVMLYQLLTGAFPYKVEGSMREVMDNITGVQPRPPRRVNRAIPRDAEVIVLKALSKEREERFQTAGEMARDIERHLAGEPIEARRDTLYLARRLARRTGPAMAFGLALAVAAVLGGVVVWALMDARVDTLQSQVDELIKRRE
jgi:eukaryotic-like serine/threonine-protein kinase